MRYALRITGDEEQARDVVQETFLRLWKQDPGQIRLGEWLFTVCRNRALTVRKKEGRMSPLTQQEAETRPSREAGPAERTEDRDTLRHILRLIDGLPKRQQEVLRLKFQNGLSYREIGSATQLSVSNVGFLLHTALKRIRRAMDEQRTGRASLGRTQ